mmetsp:Transcript_3000/g.6941  ORF Transcript_3000/g.6941 Transcript_3000/m.6941 type:complete len:221 (-) Transcript_3000:2077-2739(-)
MQRRETAIRSVQAIILRLEGGDAFVSTVESRRRNGGKVPAQLLHFLCVLPSYVFHFVPYFCQPHLRLCVARKLRLLRQLSQLILALFRLRLRFRQDLLHLGQLLVVVGLHFQNLLLQLLLPRLPLRLQVSGKHGAGPLQLQELVVIQLAHDPERRNVGVDVFCPAEHFVQVAQPGFGELRWGRDAHEKSRTGAARRTAIDVVVVRCSCYCWRAILILLHR